MKKFSKYTFSFGIILFLFALCGAVRIASAQDRSSQNANSSNSNSNLNPDTTPTPVPFSEVISQAESTSTTLKEIASSTTSDTDSEVIKRDLPKIVAQIDAKIVETASLLAARPSLEGLRTFETEWNALTKTLPEWKDQLSERGKALDNDLKQLDEIEEKWKKTQLEFQGQDVPPQVSGRVEEILATTGQLRKDLEAARADTIALQGRVVEQQDRAKEALDSIKQSRESLVGRLLVRDSPPIWSSSLWQSVQNNLSTSAAATFSSQISDLRTFISVSVPQIGSHLAIFVLLALALFVIHRRTESLIENEPELKNAAVIFSLPVPTAFVIAIFAYPWIYSQTPQILKAIFGAAVLIPTVMIVRKLVERPIYPILYSLVVFYFIDQFRIIVESLPGLFRLVFMVEMLGGALFFLWIYFGKLERDKTEEIVYGPIFKTIKTAAIIAVPIFAISFLANIFGFVGLARLTGNAVLKSAYAAVILYAAVRILDRPVDIRVAFSPVEHARNGKK